MPEEHPLREIQVRTGHPDFVELPWSAPLKRWAQLTERTSEMPRYVSSVS